MAFDAARCLRRFRRIQQFRSDAGLECLVAICGSDGSFHRGSDVLRRYLLCGESGRDLALGSSERFDEVVIAFGNKKNTAFCPQSQAKEFAHLTAMWPDLEIVVGPGVPEDNDYDIAKISAFVAMVENITGTLGVLGDDPEKWPLVQAFALDEWPGARRGFLSAVLSIQAVDSLLEMVYSQFDLPAQEKLIEKLGAFEAVWTEAIEEKKFLPLKEHYEYGLIQDNDVEEAFPGRAKYAAEPRRRIEPASTASTFVAVDPTLQVVVARTIPQCALESGSGATTEDVSTIKELRQLVQGFDLNPFEKGVEDALKERWKGDGLKVTIDRYDATGFRIPPASAELVDPMSVLALESGTCIVTVFATVKNICWGETFLACKVAPHAKAPLRIVPLTTNFASPFSPAEPFKSTEFDPCGHESVMRWEGFQAKGDLRPDIDPHSPGLHFRLTNGPVVQSPLENLGYRDEGDNGLWMEIPFNGLVTHVRITLEDLRAWPTKLRQIEVPTPEKSVHCTWDEMREYIIYADVHADMMPPKSRKAAMDEAPVKFTSLWVTAPAGAPYAKELCDSLAKSLDLGPVHSLRSVLFPKPETKEISQPENVPDGVVCNDLAIPVAPPLDAFVVCDFRVPAAWSPSPYNWHRWASHCVDSGFCDMCVLPAYVHGAKSVEEWDAHENVECLSELVKARNPDAEFIRPYTVDSAIVQDAMAKTDASRSMRRLCSRPGFLDHNEVQGRLSCIYLNDKECYDEEILPDVLSSLFASVGGLASIEVKVNGFNGAYTAVILPGTVVEQACPWDGVTFWLYDGGEHAEAASRAALKKCVKVLKPVTADIVTNEEMEILLKEHEIPSDWYFDGTAYVHSLGERSVKHPLWDQVYQQALKDHENACLKQNDELKKIRAEKGIQFLPSSGM